MCDVDVERKIQNPKTSGRLMPFRDALVTVGLDTVRKACVHDQDNCRAVGRNRRRGPFSQRAPLFPLPQQSRSPGLHREHSTRSVSLCDRAPSAIIIPVFDSKIRCIDRSHTPSLSDSDPVRYPEQAAPPSEKSDLRLHCSNGIHWNLACLCLLQEQPSCIGTQRETERQH